MVTGGSYGGHMTLAVATYYPDRIRCALDIVGPSNLATFLEHTSAYRRDLWRNGKNETRGPNKPFIFKRNRPQFKAAMNTKPLLLVAHSIQHALAPSRSEL